MTLSFRCQSFFAAFLGASLPDFSCPIFPALLPPLHAPVVCHMLCHTRAAAFAPLFRAWSSSPPPLPQPPPSLLLRDFLHDRLAAYFSPDGGAPSPVGVLRAPLPFQTLLGRSDYEAHVAAAYEHASVSWFTPAELFRPMYARGFAAAALAAHDPATGPLTMFELGGGAGTFARDFLDCVAERSPAVFEGMSYTCVDASPFLAARQADAVCGGTGGDRRGRVFRAEARDATRREGWGKTRAEPCVVIACELFDNLPHDRAVCVPGGDGAESWAETRVTEASEHCLLPVESLAPMTDELISRCLAVWLASLAAQPQARGIDAVTNAFRRAFFSRPAPPTHRPSPVFLPTCALRLFDAFHAARPSFRLLVADFDALPGTTIAGSHAPLVASQRAGGGTEDHPTYLLPRHCRADILFPTNFQLLSSLLAESASRAGVAPRAGSQPVIYSTEQFMRRYAEFSRCETASGFNPLLAEFPNTRILSTL